MYMHLSGRNGTQATECDQHAFDGVIYTAGNIQQSRLMRYRAEPSLAPTHPFDDVELGPMLGQGSFGKVFRGIWNGAHVAVKVCTPLISRQLSLLSLKQATSIDSGSLASGHQPYLVQGPKLVPYKIL